VWALFGLMAAGLAVMSSAIFDMFARVDGLRSDLHGEIAELRSDVSAQLGELRADMKSRFEVVHADIRELRTALRAS
jgi:hypothetical protein